MTLHIYLHNSNPLTMMIIKEKKSVIVTRFDPVPKFKGKFSKQLKKRLIL